MNSLKNLLHVLSRFKVASCLNILGLSIAFASFCVIMMQVNYERNFDRCHERIDRIYRVEWNWQDNEYVAMTQRPVNYALAQSPHVEQMSLYSPAAALTKSMTVQDGAEEKSFLNSILEVSPSFTRIFSFEFLSGDASALETPGSIILPESLARAYFRNVPAQGQVIRFDDTVRTVTAVYKDFPKNSSIGNRIYYTTKETRANDWGSANDYAFVLLDDPENAAQVLQDAVPFINYQRYGYASTEELAANIDKTFRLNPLKNLYYDNDVKFTYSETGSRRTTYLLICVAFLVIVIAAINFTNFSTALTPMRIKGINTRKVMGGSAGSLRRRLVAEGIYIAFLAYLLSLLIIFICKGTFIEGFVSSGIDFAGSAGIFLITALISIVTGALAGIYPACYMTSFPPAMALKGSFGLSPKGRKIRTVLLSVQYVASIALLIVSTFMMIQNRLMLRTSFGYDKDQVVTVMLNDNIHQSEEAFMNSLTQDEGIDYAGFSYSYISCGDDFPNWSGSLNGEQIQYVMIPATRDLPKALGVHIVEGRDFLESDDHVSQGAYIFNEMAKEQFGLKVGDRPGPEVVGFMSDIVYTTFRRPTEPMCFWVFGAEGNPGFPMNVCYIRIHQGADYEAALRHIRKTLDTYVPGTDFEIRNLDGEIESAYRQEKSVSSLITLFGVIAILISIVGIYGLVIFETEYKRKEIGIRKVFGSTVKEIMSMFSTKYIRLVAVCAAVAVPISYWFVSRWLGRFEIRTPVYWWVFVSAFLVICAVTLLTCSWQNYRAACENPVEAVKGE